MATFFITTTTITPGVASTLNSFDRLFVTQGGSLISTANSAVVAAGLFSRIEIDGYVGASGTAIQLGPLIGSGGGSNTLVIGTGGRVVGSNGISLAGGFNTVLNGGEIRGNFGILGGFFDSNNPLDSLVTNTGTILGAEVGILLENATSSSIANSGTIASATRAGGTSSGLLLGELLGGIVTSGDAITVTNSGEIVTGNLKGYGIAVAGSGTHVTNSGLVQTSSQDASRAAVDTPTTTGQVARIVNTATGVIVSPVTAVDGGAGDETVTNAGEVIGDVRLGAGTDTLRNSGSIDGEVTLGDGDDLYRAMGSGSVSGTVDGGAGNDRLAGGSADDTFSGGADADTLLGRDGEDTLSGGDGDDVLSGGAGDDLLIGDNGFDRLLGGAGDDVLRGGGGADVLDGGRGDDVLTGGNGPDVFVFGLDAGHDVVNDLVGADRIDLTAYHLAGFSALAGSLSTVPGGVLIDLDGIGGSGSVFLSGVALSSLDASDFIF